MRRRALSLVLSLPVALGLATMAQATEPVTIRLADLAQSLNEIGSKAMIDQKIDKKHGLNVKYSAYPTLDGLFTAIRGKQVDVGFSGWTAIAQFRGKGFPVMTFFPVGRGVTVDIIVPQDSAIQSIADLKGKKVGSFAGAAGTATVLFRVITTKFYGFDPGKTNDLQYAGPGLLPSLIDKEEIVAAVMFDPLAAKLEASGKYRSIGNLADLYKQHTGNEFLWIGVATNDEFAQKNPDALRRFTSAWIEAVEYVKKTPQVFEDYGRRHGLDEKAVALLRDRVSRDYITRWDDDFISSFTTFAEMANDVMGGGYLDSVPDAAFTTRFAPKN